jgi:hypothetical protein
MRLLAATALMAMCLWHTAASAATLLVGSDQPLKTPSQAAAVAQDGDTVDIAPGEYFDCAIWHQDHLTIEGAAPGVILTDKTCEGKALFVIAGHDVVVRRIAFLRARVPDGNGAGIRAEGIDLTVEQCRFENDEDGILAAASPESRLTIRDSTFVHDGKCAERCAHGVYTNEIAALDIERSTFDAPRGGHHVKSEARETRLVGNIIRDGVDGTSSYLVELPIGGALAMADNVLEKGPKTDNRRAAIMLGTDGERQPTPVLVFARNRFTNDTGGDTIFVLNWTGTAPTMTGNVIEGPGVTELSRKGAWLARLRRGASAVKDEARHLAGWGWRTVLGQ